LADTQPVVLLDVLKLAPGLTLIHGPPEAGKTTVATMLAREMAVQGREVVYFDTSPAGEGVSRLYSTIGGAEPAAERIKAVVCPPKRLRRLVIPVLSRSGGAPPSLVVDELSAIFLSVAATTPADDVKARSRAYREMLAVAALMRAYGEGNSVTCIAVVDDTMEGLPVGGRALTTLTSASIAVVRGERGVRKIVVEQGPSKGVELEFRVTEGGPTLL